MPRSFDVKPDKFAWTRDGDPTFRGAWGVNEIGGAYRGWVMPSYDEAMKHATMGAVMSGAAVRIRSN